MIQSGKWIKQLQTALQQTGTIYSISRISVYSHKAGRTCTKYIVSAQDQQTGKYSPVLQSWKDIDVVTFLADQYRRVHDPGESLQCQDKTGIAEKPPENRKAGESRKAPAKAPEKGKEGKQKNPLQKESRKEKPPQRGKH